MKRRILMLAAAAALLAAPAAYSQLNPSVQARIPFAFEVSNRTLPAGEYVVETGPVPGLIKLDCADCHTRIFVGTNAVRSSHTMGEAKLVFQRYGDRYFLRQIWTVGTDTGREVPMSKAEKELARSAAPGGTITLAGR